MYGNLCIMLFPGLLIYAYARMHTLTDNRSDSNPIFCNISKCVTSFEWAFWIYCNDHYYTEWFYIHLIQLVSESFTWTYAVGHRFVRSEERKTRSEKIRHKIEINSNICACVQQFTFILILDLIFSSLRTHKSIQSNLIPHIRSENSCIALLAICV